MVHRLGIGATSASAVIFSTILVCNFLVYASSQDRQGLYSKSDALDSLWDQAAALEGAGATNILLRAQQAFATGVLSCPTAVLAANQLSKQLYDTQSAGGLVVKVNSSLDVAAGRSDNLSMLTPYNGSVPGDADFSISVAMSGSDIANGVALQRNEVHYIFLPIRLQSLVDACLSAFTIVSNDMSSFAPANCTEKAVGPLMEGAERAAASLVASVRLSDTFVYSLVQGVPCAAKVTMQVSQSDIVGPGGSFAVSMQMNGTVSFGI